MRMDQEYTTSMNLFTPWAWLPAAIGGLYNFISSGTFLYSPFVSIDLHYIMALLVSVAGALLMAFLCGLMGSLAKFVFDKLIRPWLEKMLYKWFGIKIKSKTP